jgi:hypothetical protein
MARFFRRGISKIYWLPAVADVTTVISPTRAEITAGEDLSPSVADIAGFQLQNSPIPVPNLAEMFTPQIDGEDTVTDSALTFNDDDDDEVVRLLLQKGEVGFICLMPYGDVPTKRCEIWAVKSTGFNDEWSLGNDPARAMAGFAVTRTPEQNGIIPAAV